MGAHALGSVLAGCSADLLPQARMHRTSPCTDWQIQTTADTSRLSLAHRVNTAAMHHVQRSPVCDLWLHRCAHAHNAVQGNDSMNDHPCACLQP